MSVKSTYYINRETAIRVVLSKIYELSDEALSEVLEDLPGSEFRNYAITDYLDEERFVINSVEEF